MNSELKSVVYADYLNDLTENEIAKKHNLSRSMVHRTLSSIKGTLEHRISQIAIYEFEEYFIKLKDAIEKDVREITQDMEREEDPERKDRLRQMRHQRRLDIWKLLGDGDMVLVMKKSGSSKGT